VEGSDADAARVATGSASNAAPTAPEVAALVELVAADRGGGSGVCPPSEAARTAFDPAADLPPPRALSRWRRLLGAAPREIVVEAMTDRAPPRVLWLRWAFAQGAALVLAPGAASWVDVVLFARPTVLWGGGAEARALLDRVRGRRRCVDRLRAFCWLEEQPVPPEIAEGLGSLGVALLLSQRPAGDRPETG
jgi:hypothetical protein